MGPITVPNSQVGELRLRELTCLRLQSWGVEEPGHASVKLGCQARAVPHHPDGVHVCFKVELMSLAAGMDVRRLGRECLEYLVDRETRALFWTYFIFF